MTVGLSAEIAVTRGGFRLDVRVEVPPGEVLAVLGPNGSGKSTLLAVLAGLVRPTSGLVRVRERTLLDVAARVDLPPHKRNVGLLAQDPLLFPHLSALANVAFGPRSRGVGRRPAEELAGAWLSEVDGSALADRRPAALSGGQAQRVALARALATEPDLLLLDEPFAALDVDAAPALRGLVRKVLRNRGRQATLLVTHDPLDALVLADRVLVLADGAIVEQGPTREVLARPRTAFTARIAGLDLVPGVAGPEGLRTGDGSVVAGVSHGALAMHEPAVAVFRPSAVAVHLDRPHGSPRNVFPATVAALEPHGDLIRLRAGAAPGGSSWVAGLAADLTPEAVAELELDPGAPVFLVVKATEVAVYPLAAGS
jgi:molybdate transport system ATP-binding protein